MKSLLASLILCALLPAFAGEEVTVEGIAIPAERDELSLQGAGLLRKGFFFKIYVGALYLEESEHAEAVLEEVPKRIDIHYFHHTPKRHMVRVAESTLKKNMSAETYQELTPKINQLHEAYLNGKKGAIASLIYQPGVGLTYAFNGDEVITIEGDIFANAYFNVWLGEQPSSKSMKRAMLGGDA